MELSKKILRKPRRSAASTSSTSSREGSASHSAPVLQLQSSPPKRGKKKGMLSMREPRNLSATRKPADIKKESIEYAKRFPHLKGLTGMINSLQPQPVPPHVPWLNFNHGKHAYRIAFPVHKFQKSLLHRLYGKKNTNRLLKKHGRLQSVLLVYENDGSGINPGGGTDQGPTARLSLYFEQRSPEKNKRKFVGITAIDMQTPVPPQLVDHKVPKGKKKSDTTYDVKENGPYSGIQAIHFGTTIFNTNHWQIDYIQSLGVDNPQWGKWVQDEIHKKVNSPKFPWKGKYKLFAESGVHSRYTRKFNALELKGKYIFDQKAKVGTKGGELQLGAKLQIDLIKLRNFRSSFRFGASGNAHFRGNDGRKNIQKGLEAGFVGGLRTHFGDRVSLSFSYRDIKSMDPVKKTKLKRSNRAWAQRVPWAGSTEGGHKIGKITLEIRFP